MSLNGDDLKLPLLGQEEDEEIGGGRSSTDASSRPAGSHSKHSLGFGALVFLIYYNIGVPFGDEEVRWAEMQTGREGSGSSVRGTEKAFDRPGDEHASHLCKISSGRYLRDRDEIRFMFLRTSAHEQRFTTIPVANRNKTRRQSDCYPNSSNDVTIEIISFCLHPRGAIASSYHSQRHTGRWQMGERRVATLRRGETRAKSVRVFASLPRDTISALTWYMLL